MLRTGSSSSCALTYPWETAHDPGTDHPPTSRSRPRPALPAGVLEVLLPAHRPVARRTVAEAIHSGPFGRAAAVRRTAGRESVGPVWPIRSHLAGSRARVPSGSQSVAPVRPVVPGVQPCPVIPAGRRTIGHPLPRHASGVFLAGLGIPVPAQYPNVAVCGLRPTRPSSAGVGMPAHDPRMVPRIHRRVSESARGARASGAAVGVVSGAGRTALRRRPDDACGAGPVGQAGGAGGQ